LEAARALGARGYEVALAEAGTELGGRVSRESRLPGLAAWGRVRDWRAGQIGRMPNVEVFFDSLLTADDVLGFGFEHVAVATGSAWRRDGVGRARTLPLAGEPGLPVFTPDDLMAGRLPQGRVVLYDDDHFYMGGVLAELLVARGIAVTLVTPAVRASDWTTNTLEQGFIQRRLLERGVEIVTSRVLAGIGPDFLDLACAYTGRPSWIDADAAVLVTARLPADALYLELKGREAEWGKAGLASVTLIGDAAAPAPIAWAVYAGHRYARELDEPNPRDAPPFRREIAELADRGQEHD
jgi:dimethylamine/trimethylamine dehydrogenase